ncbi:MAG: UbiA family prenyltransferase, partial [bacterium]|nr:UbiA family prenyltransferase [bacterium]
GFILAAAQLNNLALTLSPLCLGLLFFYSLSKRFTHFTQFFLGLALGMAPIGATIAVSGKITPSSLVLGLAVLLWVAGFDLLYSLQDLEFDRSSGLHSLAVRLGPHGSFSLARGLHGIFLATLALYGVLENFTWIYWVGLVISAGFLAYEHWTLRGGLKNLQAAFFTANGLLSLCFLAFVLADLFFRFY